MNVIPQMTLKSDLDKLLKINEAGVAKLADAQDLKVKVVNSAKLLQTLTSLLFVLTIEEVFVTRSKSPLDLFVPVCTGLSRKAAKKPQLTEPHR